MGTCSATCGNGLQAQNRVCNNPAPSGGGLTCPGSATQSVACKIRECPGGLTQSVGSKIHTLFWFSMTEN